MFNWLSARFSRKPYTPVNPALAAARQTFASTPLAGAPYARLYQQSPWVYVAVNRISEAAALAPLHIFRRTAQGRVEIPGHPLARLLAAPNPHLSQFELIEQTVGALELAGNAFWYLAADARGLPAEIWPLAPERVSVVPDPERYLRGYVYEIDGQRIPLEPEEIVHFRRWHSANDYYGLSALEAARLAVGSDRAMAEWNFQTFGQENGVPAGIVSIKEFVTDADFERIKRDWKASYGGTQRRTAFLRGGGIEWHDIGLSHHDLDFLKGREAHRDEILHIWRTHRPDFGQCHRSQRHRRRAPVHRTHALPQTGAHRPEDQRRSAAVLGAQHRSGVRGHPPDGCAGAPG
ncbi:MAG TPA: phage portal protein [Candidatus Limnocylindrales bacterium]|nr:phage portal protein [Candidatus Limnocylindrales bacterium]